MDWSETRGQAKVRSWVGACSPTWLAIATLSNIKCGGIDNDHVKDWWKEKMSLELLIKFGHILIFNLFTTLIEWSEGVWMTAVFFG